MSDHIINTTAFVLGKEYELKISISPGALAGAVATVLTNEEKDTIGVWLISVKESYDE